MNRTWLLGLGAAVLVALAVSAISPYDRATWSADHAALRADRAPCTGAHPRRCVHLCARAARRRPHRARPHGDALGQGAEEFLGTQGDPWDTQSDMFMALIGAGSALAVLARPHDRQMRRFVN